MKRIAYLSATLLAIVSLMSSCSDFLDSENKSSGSDADEYFSTEEGITAAKAAAFYQLYSVACNYDMYCSGTDLYRTAGSRTADEFYYYTITADESVVSDFYSNCYKIEQYANFYMETAGSKTEGEAVGTFLRAYAYYLLTQQFGSVPYIGRYVSDNQRYYPKAGLDSLYTIMEEQLTDVYNSGLLPETAHDGNVSNQAVACLLAKFYLAHAWDIDTKLDNATKGTYTVNSTSNFSKAAEWAVKAINGQGLSQTFEEKWHPDNEGNVEQIWSVQYERAGYPGDIASGGHSMQSDFGNEYGDVLLYGQKECSTDGAQTEKSLYLWDEGDARYDATFMMTHCNWDGINWGTSGYFAYYNSSDATTQNIAYKYYPYWWTEEEVEADLAANASRYVSTNYAVQNPRAYIMANPGTRYTFKVDGTYTKESNLAYSDMYIKEGGCPTVKKFDDPGTQQLNSDEICYRDIVIFDLSDMYLTAAEAYLLAGNSSTALSYVNQVRTRSGASTLSSFSAYSPQYVHSSDITPLDVILDERGRELYAQQLRWMDLRRTKQLVRYNIEFSDFISSVADMTGNDGEIRWLRPIPLSALNGNEAVSTNDQNPGY